MNVLARQISALGRAFGIGSRSYRDLILSHSPVAYWRLGETSGTVGADETGTHNGTFQGAVTLGQTGAITGDSDTGVLLAGGVTSFPLNGVPNGLPIGNAARTIELWFKTSSVAGAQVLMGYGAAGVDKGFGLFLVGGQVYIWFYQHDTNTNFTYPLNEWVHIALTWDGSRARFYANGVNVFSQNFSAIDTIPTDGALGGDRLSFGGDDYGNTLFGSIDEAAIYNRVLSHDEVFAHYIKGVADGKLSYILRDDFTTAQATPLPETRACEPTGSLTVYDPDNRVSISGGKLVLIGNQDVSKPIVRTTNRFARAIGRTVVFHESATINAEMLVSHDIDWDQGYEVRRNQDRIRYYSGGLDSFQNQVGLSAYSRFAFVLQNTGATFLGWNGTTWVYIWREPRGGDTPLHAGVICHDGTQTLDALSILDLAPIDSRFASDYGLATSRIEAPAEGASFTHEADFVMEWTQTALPTAFGYQINIHFRKQDSSNYWWLFITYDGVIYLCEVVAGNVTVRGTYGAGTAIQGRRFVIVVEGKNIRIYAHHELLLWYSEATNFQTSTSGQVASLGNDGVISNLVTYPRNITVPALTYEEPRRYGAQLSPTTGSLESSSTADFSALVTPAADFMYSTWLNIDGSVGPYSPFFSVHYFSGRTFVNGGMWFLHYLQTGAENNLYASQGYMPLPADYCRDKWAFIVAGRKDGRPVFSLNGSEFYTYPVFDLTTAGHVGAGPRVHNFHPWSVSRMSFHSVTPTAEAVAELYNGGRGQTYETLSAGLKTGLKAFWNFEEATGTRFDSHGENHLLEIGGAVGRVAFPEV
jgi:hypothetical protein